MQSGSQCQIIKDESIVLRRKQLHLCTTRNAQSNIGKDACESKTACVPHTLHGLHFQACKKIYNEKDKMQKARST